MIRSQIATINLAMISLFIAIAIIAYPKEALEASIRGLDIWWKSVFPALLPFFIVAELLINFGVVRFIGVLLEPFMRPLFRVPGIGGFIWAMGMASGNPVGAKLSVRLRQDGQVTQLEGERLVAFTSCANPLFIFGAVSVGFFHNPALGIILASAHYSANIFVGLIMRFYGMNEKANTGQEDVSPSFSIKKAFREMHRTRIKNKKPFGKLLGDAVSGSVQTLLMVGGFIILFSVLNRLLSVMHITDFLGTMIQFVFSLFFLPEPLSIPFISGLFEMTIGSQLVSELVEIPLLQQALVVSFMLAFGGFSIQAQVASILAQSDLRFFPFFIGRIFQGCFASLITLVLWQPLYVERLSHGTDVAPAFQSINGQTLDDWLEFTTNFGPVLTIGTIIVYTLIYAKRHFHPSKFSS